MDALICKMKKLRPTGLNFIVLLMYSQANSFMRSLGTWYRPSSMEINEWDTVPTLREQTVHLEIIWTKRLLVLLNLIIQQHGEVGSSITVFKTQVEKQRVWDTKSHIKSSPEIKLGPRLFTQGRSCPLIQWHCSRKPQCSRIPASYSAYPPKVCCQELAFPNLTSLGFMPA